MNTWVLERFGENALRREDRPPPVPGPGQVLLAMSAVSLNYRDLLMADGAYDPRQALPLVPCSDGVGEVAAVGEGVTRLTVGDRVCPLFSQGWVEGPPTASALRRTLGGPLDGTLRAWMVIDADAAVRPPPHLTDEEAACLPCAGVTAWRALVTEGGVKPGDRVLTLGTGGVSLFALQVATALGAHVAVASSSDAKLERARGLGAVLGLNYRDDPAWGRTIAAWSEGGVDLVVEVGGAETLGQSLRAVRPGGTIALIGNLGGSTTELQLTRVFMRHVRLQGVFVGNRADLEGLCALLDAHPDVRPVIDRVFPFEEAPAAFAWLRGAEHFGKVVVRVRG